MVLSDFTPKFEKSHCDLHLYGRGVHFISTIMYEVLTQLHVAGFKHSINTFKYM